MDVMVSIHTIEGLKNLKIRRRSYRSPFPEMAGLSRIFIIFKFSRVFMLAAIALIFVSSEGVLETNETKKEARKASVS